MNVVILRAETLARNTGCGKSFEIQVPTQNIAGALGNSGFNGVRVCIGNKRKWAVQFKFELSDEFPTVVAKKGRNGSNICGYKKTTAFFAGVPSLLDQMF